MRFFGVFILLCLFLATNVGWSQDKDMVTVQLNKPVRGSKELTGSIRFVKGNGIVFRLDSGSLSPTVPYTNFTEESLKKLADMDPRVKRNTAGMMGGPAGGGGSSIPVMPAPQVQPLDPPNVVEVEDRPELPEKRSIFGAIFGTGPGLILVLLVWGANIWAGYAIGIYRRWPKWMVPTISAAAPIVAPIVFISMKPKKVEKKGGVGAAADDEDAKPAKQKNAAVAKPVAKAKVVTARPGAPGAGGAAGAARAAARPAGGAAAPAQAAAPIAAPAQPGAAAAPQLEAAAYVKGQVNINKRFIETKFAPFFKLVPDEPYRSAWLCFITTRGEFWAKRIPKITQTDVTVQCPQEGGGQTDQVCQIADIKEIHLRPPE